MGTKEIEAQIPETTKDRTSHGTQMTKELSARFTKRFEDRMNEVENEEFEKASPTDINTYWEVRKRRCFLSTAFISSFGTSFFSATIEHHTIDPSSDPKSNFTEAIKNTIHVPAYRRKSIRNYPTAEVGGSFPGTFEDYTASVVAKWEADGDPRLESLVGSLGDLALTSGVSTRRVSDAEVELRVARPSFSDSTVTPAMVSLADVGIGVSYVLPVLVALEAAAPGQIVYIEQPESHLHPRAEYGLAKALVKAAKRGVRVVAETHSSLLLLHIQTIVARGELDPSKVGLHWFSLSDEGFTNIEFVQPDEKGQLGDWPEDFADIELYANSHFIRASRSKQKS